MDGLQGTIKVPKGGKVKKGWQVKFIILDDNVLKIFNSEEEYRSLREPGARICSLEYLLITLVVKYLLPNRFRRMNLFMRERVKLT